MTTKLFKIYLTELFKSYTTEDFVLDERFRKLVRGELGSNKLLEEFIEKYPKKREEIFLAVKILKELQAGKHQQSNKRKLNIWERIVKKNKRQVRLKYFRYAAAFLMIIGVGGASLYFLNQKSTFEYFIASKEVSNNNVSLILSDGKEFIINNKQSKVLYSADGAGISVNDITTLEQSVKEDGINQIIVPYGQRSSILLSDGTKVWLNSGSRMVYSPVFKGKIREVFLEGEALFDVAKDADKPFYVKTEAYNIKVFGTKFNVMAYKQDNLFNTVLVEGKVSLSVNGQLIPKEVLLAPNQKASFSVRNKNFQISEVDNIENYIAWIDGYLFFDNEEILSVLKKVSRYYNITIEYMLPSDRTKISGKLDLKDDPERVLKGLAIISGTRFFKQENKYVFYE
jgi:transmembrane sensor